MDWLDLRHDWYVLQNSYNVVFLIYKAKSPDWGIVGKSSTYRLEVFFRIKTARVAKKLCGL